MTSTLVRGLAGLAVMSVPQPPTLGWGGRQGAPLTIRDCALEVRTGRKAEPEELPILRFVPPRSSTH